MKQSLFLQAISKFLLGVVLVLMMQYSKKLATSLIGKMGH